MKRTHIITICVIFLASHSLIATPKQNNTCINLMELQQNDTTSDPETKNTCFCRPCTISTPGSYILCCNINGPITITSDNVTLNLNGYTITPREADEYAIKISNCSQIRVYDGFIKWQNHSDISNDYPGINIQNAHNVKIENMQIDAFFENEKPRALGIYCRDKSTACTIQNCIFNCQYGILFVEASGCTVQNCTISSATNEQHGAIGVFFQNSNGCTMQNCTVQNQDIGLRLFKTNDCTFQKINITNGIQAGASLQPTCNNNVFYQCNIVNMETNTDFNFGFFLCTDCNYNIFQECNINKISCNSISHSAFGFYFTNCSNNKVVNCNIKAIHGRAAGIAMFDRGKNVIDGNIIDTISTGTSQYPAAGIINQSPQNVITNNTISNVENSNEENDSGAAFGIYTNADYATVDANTIQNITGMNGISNAGVTGIYCDTDSSHNIINNNNINHIDNKSTGTPKREYGIFVHDNSDYNSINENQVESSYYGFKTGTATHNSVLGNNTNNNTVAYDGTGIFSQDASAALSPNYKINYFHS